MKIDKSSQRIGIIILCIGYVLLAGIESKRSGLHYVLYAFLPSVFVYLRINEEKLISNLYIGLCSVYLLWGTGLSGLMAFLYYGAMALVLYRVLQLRERMFKKAILSVILMLIVFIATFAILEKLKSGPGFFVLLNQMFTDSDLLKQISAMMAQAGQSGGAALLDLDKNMIRLLVSSSIPVMILTLVGGITMLNFGIISLIMNAHNKFVQRVSPPWTLSFPRNASRYMLIVLILTYIFSSSLGDFGLGIFLSTFMISMLMFSVQGMFVLSFLLKKTGLSSTLNVVLTFLIGILLMISSIGGLLMANAGFIDLMFNIRRLPRNGGRSEVQ